VPGADLSSHRLNQLVLNLFPFTTHFIHLYTSLHFALLGSLLHVFLLNLLVVDQHSFGGTAGELLILPPNSVHSFLFVGLMSQLVDFFGLGIGFVALFSISLNKVISFFFSFSFYFSFDGC